MDTTSIINALNWDAVTGGRTDGRVQILRTALESGSVDIQRLRLEECADEQSGRRYGLARCRVGRCIKLGGGGRNKGSRYAYQVWAVWA